MNNSVSIAKGLGILMMVLAHAMCPEFMRHFIAMFHMPLFFFLSGFCFKEAYLSDNKLFVTKRIKGLYYPYVKYSLLFLLLHNIFFYVNIYNTEYGFNGSVSNLYTLKEYLINGFNIMTRMVGHEQLLGGFWFLKQLLFASIIGLFTIKYISNAWIGGGILIVFAFVLRWTGLRLPFFGIDSLTFLSSFFFVCGYIYKHVKARPSYVLLSLLFILVAIGSHFFCASMLTYKTWNVLPYLVTAIIGSVATYLLSEKITKFQGVLKRALVYIGNNTMPILVWHFLSFKVVSLIIIGLYQEPIQRLAEFPVLVEYSNKGWWIVYFLVGLTIPLLVSIGKEYFNMILQKQNAK